MGESTSIRKSPRVKTDYEAHFSSQRSEGAAVLADVSCCGARLERATPRPNVGANAVVYVDLPSDSRPIQLSGRVARLTDTGFAIQFEETTKEALEWLKQVAGQDPASEEEMLDESLNIDEPLPPSALKSRPVSEAKGSAETTPPAAKPSAGSSSGTIDLDGLSIAGLEKLQKQIELKLQQLRKEDAAQKAREVAKKKLRDEVAKLAEKEGFTLEDLVADEKS